MSFFGVKLAIALVAVSVISSCSAKFLEGGEYNFCEYCVFVVDKWKHELTQYDTPEKLATYLRDVWCPHVRMDPHTAVGWLADICKGLAGKEDVFAKEYFKTGKDWEVDPCKVVDQSC